MFNFTATSSQREARSSTSYGLTTESMVMAGSVLGCVILIMLFICILVCREKLRDREAQQAAIQPAINEAVPLIRGA